MGRRTWKARYMVLINEKLAYFDSKAVREGGREGVVQTLHICVSCSFVGVGAGARGLDCGRAEPRIVLHATVTVFVCGVWPADRLAVCWQAYDAGKPPLKGLYIPVSFYNVSPAVRRPTVIVKGGRGRLLAPPRACHRDGRLRGRCLLCSPGRDGVRVTTQGHCQGGVRA